MALTATTNISANTALRYLSQTRGASSSLAKLSSGSRIVKASDDAASLAVGTKIKADVTALKQAAVNAGQASSLLQVADGGMSKVADILQRMKALAVQAQSGSVTDNERTFLDREYQQLTQQVDAIAGQTKFNGGQLINGSAGKTLTSTFSTSAAGDHGAAVGQRRGRRLQLAYAYTAGSSLGEFTLTDTTSTSPTPSSSPMRRPPWCTRPDRLRQPPACSSTCRTSTSPATFAGTDAAIDGCHQRRRRHDLPGRRRRRRHDRGRSRRHPLDRTGHRRHRHHHRGRRRDRRQRAWTVRSPTSTRRAPAWAR